MARARRRATLFDRWSVTYDAPGLQRLAYRPIHDAVLDRIADLAPSTVVDLGCGTGRLTHRLGERFPDAVLAAVDLSDGMLSRAAGRLAEQDMVSLVQADAERLPFASCSVDLVVCTESFHWYPHQAQVIDELARVMSPGGRLLIASIAALTGFGERALRAATSTGGTAVRALPPRELRNLLDRSGFEVVDQRRIPRLGTVAWPVLTDARR